MSTIINQLETVHKKKWNEYESIGNTIIHVLLQTNMEANKKTGKKSKELPKKREIQSNKMHENNKNKQIHSKDEIKKIL